MSGDYHHTVEFAPVLLALVLGLLWAGIIWFQIGTGRMVRAAALGALWVMALGSLVTAIGTPREAAVDYTTPTAAWATAVHRGAFVLVLVLALVGLLPVAGPRRRPVTAAAAGFAVFAFASLVAGRLATAPSTPLVAVVVPLAGAALLRAPGIDLATIVSHLRGITRLFTWGSLAAAIVNFGWAFSVNAQVQPRTLFGLPQMFGLTTHPNGLGAVAAFALIVELASVERNKHYRWHALAAAAVLVLSLSRTGLLAAAVGLILLRGPTSRAVRVVMGMAAIIAVTAVMVLPTMLDKFLTSGGVTTHNRRLFVWHLTLQEFDKNPLFGYGPSLFDATYRDRYLGPGLAFIGQAHDQFVQTLGQGGLAVGAALACYLITLIITGARGARASGGLSLALVGLILVRCLTESPLLHRSPDLGVVMEIGTLLAASTAASRKAGEDTRCVGDHTLVRAT